MKSAKMLVYMLLGSGVLGCALSAQTNPDAKFTLALRAIDPVVTLGLNVTLEINITNISAETLTLPFGSHGAMPDGMGNTRRPGQAGLRSQDENFDTSQWANLVHPKPRSRNLLDGPARSGKVHPSGRCSG